MPSGNNAAGAQSRVDKGRQLYGAGDLEGALKAFLAAKKLYPETTSTLNAAICLEELGRYDEALELYEDVLINFPSGLTDPNKEAIVDTIANLTQKLGTVEIDAADRRDFVVLLDGRRRVKLQSGGRLRVLAGKHSLKILRDGYEPVELTLHVDPARSVRREIDMKPLSAMLRVEVDAEVPTDFEVFVDGRPVGRTPWEGQVRPGAHIVRTEKDNLGSMPIQIEVVQGKTNDVRLGCHPLGPPVYLLVEPATAQVKLDDLTLGAGWWSGRLPLGAYTLAAMDPGYHRSSVPLRIVQGDEPLAVRITLEVDPTHPRWPKPKPPRPWLAASAGFAWAPSLSSGAETDCPDTCTNHLGAFGFLGGIRGGYRFASGLSLELEGGYAWLQASFDRVETDQVQYWLHDKLTLHGPFASVGASYHFPLGDRFGLSAGVHIGLLIASSSDPVQGLAVSGDSTAAILIEGRDNVVFPPAFFLRPELGVLWRLRSFELSIGVHLGAFLSSGPSLEHGSIRVASRGDCTSNPPPASCAPDSFAIDGERAFGPFILVSPQVRGGYVFR